jgi:hypothetical protein
MEKYKQLSMEERNLIQRGVAIFAKACFEDVLSKQAAKT